MLCLSESSNGPLCSDFCIPPSLPFVVPLKVCQTLLWFCIISWELSLISKLGGGCFHLPLFTNHWRLSQQAILSLGGFISFDFAHKSLLLVFSLSKVFLPHLFVDYSITDALILLVVFVGDFSKLWWCPGSLKKIKAVPTLVRLAVGGKNLIWKWKIPLEALTCCLLKFPVVSERFLYFTPYQNPIDQTGWRAHWIERDLLSSKSWDMIASLFSHNISSKTAHLHCCN